MAVQVKMTNDEYIKSLQKRGLDTTSVGAKEANFIDYGNALGSNVQNMVIDSFGAEGTKEGDADRALQATIAGLFKDDGKGGKDNFNNSKALKAYCDANGIKMSVTYVKTQHIVDNKLGGKYANNKTDASGGSIAVYTFSQIDPKTGAPAEIKVADANGNGGLETEELFMNEILTGITSDIATISDADLMADSGMSDADRTKLFDSSIISFKLDKNGDKVLNEDGEAVLDVDWDKYEEESKDVKYDLGQDKFVEMMKTIMIVNNKTQAEALEILKSEYTFSGFDPENTDIPL